MKKSSSSGFFDRIIKKTIREPRPQEPLIIENVENDIPPGQENSTEDSYAAFSASEDAVAEDYFVQETEDYSGNYDALEYDSNPDILPDSEKIFENEPQTYDSEILHEQDIYENYDYTKEDAASYETVGTADTEFETAAIPPPDVRKVKSRRRKKSYNEFDDPADNNNQADAFQNSIRQQKMRSNMIKTCFFLIALFVAAFCILPVLLTFLNSFMSTEEISINYGPVFSSVSNTGWNQGETPVFMTEQPHLKFIPEMVSINQYKTVLFDSPAYLLKFWNSVYYTVIIVVLQIVVGSLAAYSFSRYRRKRREVLFFSYIILMLMPYQVTIVPNYLISRNLGILDTRSAILLPGIFSTFSVFLLTKYMRQIPSSYIEAAKLDGAGEWQIFTRIAIPMAKSALYAMAILIFVDYWNMVEQPLLLLQKSEDLQPLSLFLSKINQGEVGIAFAASFIFMFPPLLIFMHGEQYLVEGISHSGLK